MGQTWHAPAGAPRPAHRMGLYLRRDLSREGERRRAGHWCDTDAMAAHLIEISAAVDPGAHAVLIVDQAGWHLTPKLAIPDNITVLALPPRSPEEPGGECLAIHARQLVVEPDLQILRRHRRAVLPSWNNLIDQPWKIMSLGMRKWAHGFFNDRWYYGTILTASHCGASRRGPGTRPRAVVCWRWPRPTMVAAGRMRRGSAASVCRLFVLGAALQRPRTGRAGDGHRAHPRSSTPITAAHWRRLLRPARSRRSTASCAGGEGPGAVALGDVRHLARRDHGRARVEGARLRQDLFWLSRLLKKTSPPNWRRSGRRLPKGVEIPGMKPASPEE